MQAEGENTATLTGSDARAYQEAARAFCDAGGDKTLLRYAIAHPDGERGDQLSEGLRLVTAFATAPDRFPDIAPEVLPRTVAMVADDAVTGSFQAKQLLELMKQSGLQDLTIGNGTMPDIALRLVGTSGADIALKMREIASPAERSLTSGRSFAERVTAPSSPAVDRLR